MGSGPLSGGEWAHRLQMRLERMRERERREMAGRRRGDFLRRMPRGPMLF